jgi:hypothetical protein
VGTSAVDLAGQNTKALAGPTNRLSKRLSTAVIGERAQRHKSESPKDGTVAGTHACYTIDKQLVDHRLINQKPRCNSLQRGFFFLVPPSAKYDS